MNTPLYLLAILTLALACCSKSPTTLTHTYTLPQTPQGLSSFTITHTAQNPDLLDLKLNAVTSLKEWLNESLETQETNNNPVGHKTSATKTKNTETSTTIIQYQHSNINKLSPLQFLYQEQEDVSKLLSDLQTNNI